MYDPSNNHPDWRTCLPWPCPPVPQGRGARASCAVTARGRLCGRGEMARRGAAGAAAAAAAAARAVRAAGRDAM